MRSRDGRRGQCCRQRRTAARGRRTSRRESCATICRSRKRLSLSAHCTSTISSFYREGVDTDVDVPAACSAEATGMPERKHDRGDKSHGRSAPIRAHQDEMSLRSAAPFKMITSLPAERRCRYYSKIPLVRAEKMRITRQRPPFGQPVTSALHARARRG